MYWLKRLSALKEAFFSPQFVCSNKRYPVTAQEYCAMRLLGCEAPPPPNALRGRFSLRQGRAATQSLSVWHCAHKHEIHDKEQAKALCKAVMKHTKKGNPSVAYASINKQTALI